VTNPPKGRDGSPAVAALASQLSGLRRDVESLATRVDTLANTQQEHVAVLDDITELRHQVEQILAVLTEQDDVSLGEGFWLTMTEQQHDEKSGELLDGVETVLRTQYPDYLASQIRPCWPNHPEARWELAWLYQLWSLAYLAKRTAPKDAADWHDRWCPGVIRRLSQVMRQCEGICQRQPGRKATGDSRRRVPLCSSRAGADAVTDEPRKDTACRAATPKAGSC
jgi:hypothetical protein